jgi:hypothetical protein
MTRLRSWGVIWSEAIHHSNLLNCENPECSWNLPTNSEAFKYVVGFDCGGPQITCWGAKVFGKLIFECPICFEKFWIHGDEDWVEYAFELCPLWPK